MATILGASEPASLAKTLAVISTSKTQQAVLSAR